MSKHDSRIETRVFQEPCVSPAETGLHKRVIGQLINGEIDGQTNERQASDTNSILRHKIRSVRITLSLYISQRLFLLIIV